MPQPAHNKLLWIGESVPGRFALPLKQEGFEVVSVTSGAEAVAYAADHVIDLALVTSGITDMDSADAVITLRLHQPRLAILMVPATPVPLYVLSEVAAVVRRDEAPETLLSKLMWVLQVTSSSAGAQSAA